MIGFAKVALINEINRQLEEGKTQIEILIGGNETDARAFVERLLLLPPPVDA